MKKSQDYYKKFTDEQTIAMYIRCRISGCQYGIEHIDKEPKERCIWCGEKRKMGHFHGIDITKLVENIE